MSAPESPASARVDEHVDFLIVGAGVAGLSLADRLVREGRGVLLVERDARPGGLAKSFHYDVDGRACIFDTGPKRFHTDDPEVDGFLHEVLGDDLLTIGRSSSVHLFGKYFGWPLSTRDMFRLPPSMMVRVGLDLVRKLVRRDSPPNDRRFESFILDQYGPSLYEAFFRGYTEKFIGIPASEVHEDWATTGINRSIIDKDAKGNSILELLQSVLLPRRVDTRFLYPASGGFGGFCDRLADRIRTAGGEIALSSSVDELDAANRVARVGLRRIAFDRVVWTGNLHDLGRLLGERFSRLEYLSTLFFNVITRTRPQRPDQWIYFGDSRLTMLRVSIVHNFADYLMPRPLGGLIVEKTCRFDDASWRGAADLAERLLDEMVEVGLIRDRSEVLRVEIERVRDTYPVYHADYRKGFSEIAGTIKQKYPWVVLLGRSGAFWYNNSDHSIKAALGMAKYLTGRAQREPDKDAIFSGESH